MLPFVPRKTSNSKAVELAARLVYFEAARLENHLQNSMKPETHSRNVFLNKNKRFLKTNYSGSSVLNIGHPNMTEAVEVGMHINN